MAETINIEFGGQTVTVPKWATEDTLLKVAQSLNVSTGKFGKGVKDAADSLGGERGLAGSIKKASVAADDLKVKQTALGKATKAAQTVMAGGAGLVGAIAQSKGRFEDLNAVTGIIINSLTSLASAVPFAGRAIEGLGDVAQSLFELNNAILDDTLDNFSNLAGAGFGLETNLLDLQRSALEGRISLNSLTDAVLSAQQGVLSLGSSFDDGVKRFAKTQAILANENGPYARSLRALGMGSEEIAEFLSGFVQDQRMRLDLRNMSEEQLAANSFQYAKNLRVISELTGQEVDVLREAQSAIAADGAFQSKLQQMRLNGQDQEARAIEESIAALPTAEAQQAAKELFTFGTAVTEQSALFNQIAPNFIESVQDMFNKVSAAEMFDASMATGPIQAFANIAANANNLEVGTLALIDGASNISTLIASQVVVAGQVLAALGKGQTAAEVVEETTKAQNETINKTLSGSISQFNKDIQDAAVALQALGPNMQETILQNIEPLTKVQLSAAEGLVTTINKINDGIQEFTGGGDSDGSGGDSDGSDRRGNEILNFFKKKLTFNAEGGTMAANSLGIVGEAGPELIGTDRIAQVLSNPDTRKIIEEIGAMAAYAADPFVKETRSYHDAISVAWVNSLDMSDEMLSKLGGMDISTITAAYEAMNKAGAGSRKGAKSTDLRDQKVNLEDEIGDIHFGEESTDTQDQYGNYLAQNNETLTKIEKLLKNILPKALSGNGYF